MNVLSLFSGIGCFDYGVERAGWQTVGQCEIEPFCRRALAKHWPNVWRAEDVHGITGESVWRHCGPVGAIIGGPPCQPASVAGKRGGAADDRWLWPEFLRVVREVAPVWVLAENPGGVLSLDVEGMGFRKWIAIQFANLGYEILPILLAASDLGAAHDRERIWIVGHANCGGRGWQSHQQGEKTSRRVRIGGTGEEMEHAFRAGLEERRGQPGGSIAKQPQFARARVVMAQGYDQWEWEEPREISSQSEVGTATYGDARRLARWRRAGVKAIGNAVVPQCAEMIARAISAMEGAR